MASKLLGSTKSIKHSLIDKSNTRLVVTVCVAVFAVIFSLVAAKTLWSQAAYQNRVITAKRQAVSQLKADVEVVKKLQPSYDSFVKTPTNIIGGSSTGKGPQDGDNAKIVLDALPEKYDFPALTTNLESLVMGSGTTLTSLTGTDDEIAQGSNISSSTPIPIEMPFQVTVTGNYTTMQQLIDAFGRSVRPVKVRTITIAGENQALTATIEAVTYYQPSKSLNVNTKVVK